MIRFGISRMPPEGITDEAFLDSLAERGHEAFELPFVKEFPWKEARCEQFGRLAAERGIALSVHAPYFAVLTVEDPQNRKRTLSALEHTMKLGRALGAHTVVAHSGHVKDRTPDQLHELAADGLDTIEPKVRHLGVALGLETSGSKRAFGSLGDIALIAARYSFVRPVIDWAHVHAVSGGALTTAEAFLSVITFLREQFPGWAIDPLHTQFSDNEFGSSGEIRHVAYGEGTLRSGPLAEAAEVSGLRMVVISEARDQPSHDLILTDLRNAETSPRPSAEAVGREAGSGTVVFPQSLRIERAADGWLALDVGRRLRVSNPDKIFFAADGYTKGDLLQYYASVASVLLPHLEGRALSLARYPDGADGESFYEKQCPAHAPEWMARAPLHSSHRGEPIEFCTAPDLASLIWVANLGSIEMHPWLSRVERPEYPDFAVFDLDPQQGVKWDQVVYVAGLVNVLLERLGLASYPKTSGASGIHIYVPLEPVHSYRRVRRFVETLGRMLATADPAAVSMEWDIPKRGARVFVDHNQNVGGKTIASVYSVRPVAGAQVSTPFTWPELGSVEPALFTVASVWDRLRQSGDLFAPVLTGGQILDGAEKALGLDPEDEGAKS